MLSNYTNKELETRYNRTGNGRCTQGLAATCSTCMYCIWPKDWETCVDMPTYCRRSRKESD